MARKKKTTAKSVETADYRHTGHTRPNIPTAQTEAEGQVPKVSKVRYHYSPHLAPVLRSDPTGAADDVAALIELTARRPLTQQEQKKVAEATRHYDPWLEWAGKREQHERGYFEVDPVALHIHERVSAQAIVRAAMRDDVQRDLFADPGQPYQEAIQFYRHEVDWANRLVLGDSLQVMSSLARRENLAGKVQMIYMDPPYGISYASNFQPELRRRDVKDRDSDLTREPETVLAYRDTWRLGVHTYLSYLRDRIVVARELLEESGSIFVQISDENLHRIRALLDEVVGPSNFVSVISFQTTSGFAEASGLSRTGDYLLWYAKDRERLQSYPLYEVQETTPGNLSAGWVLLPDGSYRGVRAAEAIGASPLPPESRLYQPGDLQSQGAAKEPQPFEFEGEQYLPGANNHWKASYPIGMNRLARAGRIHVAANSIRYRRFADDFPLKARGNMWTDTQTGSFTERKIFTVQTNPKVVERCILLTTKPGDLVLDPTCGSGTTAFAAERWGRRWITIDTSRVAIAVARQRILTARFEAFRTTDGSNRPSAGFALARVPHVTLKSIAQNTNLDPICDEQEPILEAALAACNAALKAAPDTVRKALGGARRLEHWTVPSSVDPSCPAALRNAVATYRRAEGVKLEAVEACIRDNADAEELVDRPEVEDGVLRVSGAFTVEGVRPEELSIGDDGLFDATPNEWEEDAHGIEVTNLNSYLSQMVQHMRSDGLTFIGNKRRTFLRLEPLFEHATGSLIHAEGIWNGGEDNGPNTVAVGFGPQYGPVTAQQVEDLIRASKRYDELVVAGFAFDAAATEVIDAAQHPKLRIHAAYIRPDINPAMQGLLKDTPSSQLFTVFGRPEVTVKAREDGEWAVRLEGVDIYDPVQNTIQSTGAEKVAAWFLDSDYDGRCFCITQAFFPDQDAWEKIAKALGSSADADAFEAFKGTRSLPFKAGKHKRIAVKVIDPRGNEVMAIRKLED